MTQNNARIAKATTAIAAVLAISSPPLIAQETAPPNPVFDTADTPATSDPLAPEAADTTPVETNLAVPPAPKPKVEVTKATATRARPSASASTPRPTVRRASTAAPVAAPVATAPVAEAAAAAPLSAESPVATPEPAPSPVADTAPASNIAGSLTTDLMASDMVPIGVGALGMLALGGAAMVARRRKRRRENAEFEERQQALAMIDEEPPILELDRRAEARPAPVFARTPAPVHDPVPERKVPMAGQSADKAATIPVRGNWESRPDAEFMFRRPGKADEPVGQG